MERDWERLGRAFAEAREALGLTQVAVAKELHVSRTPIQAVERGRQPNGRPFAKVTGTMRAYARLLGWTEESPDLVADGGDPVAAPTQQAHEGPESDLPPAVGRELRSGKTLDHTVIHLSGENDSDDVRIVVILQGSEDMTEEEIDRRFEQWRRTRRHLQAIPGESDAPSES